ncbi:MAG: cation:proton antiporter [Bacteroidia bacterium]|nr:cation:proton antiporter [Bacteroidia bacterium]
MQDILQHLLQEFHPPFKSPVIGFSLILFIILLVPLLLKRFNIPGIIGLIISGVIIGPHGLNLIEKNSAVEWFSTIGLLYIMFIAGLELDLNLFKQHKNKSLTFGILTFIVPISLGYMVCRYLLNYDVNASMLTGAMFGTHTLIAYPIVSRMGLTKDIAVAISVGGTIFTDTAVLLLFAVITQNSENNLNSVFWIRLGISILLFSFIMFVLIPRVTLWFFKRLESEKYSHYVFVLSVVFFAAFLAHASGLEPIIGAFAAGIALNKYIPHHSQLMNRIEFIGNALFIPFFLISVGMVVNLKVVLHGYQTLYVALVLTSMALFTKWLAALFTQLLFQLKKVQRQLIFGLSSAHAAATLAIIIVGFNKGIIDEYILNGTIILIMVTGIVASFSTENAAKKMILSAHHIDATNELSSVIPEQILYAVSDYRNAEKMVELLTYIKDKTSTHPVIMLAVISEEQNVEQKVIQTKQQLESVLKITSGYTQEFQILTTIDFNVANGVSRVSKEILAQLVVIGWPDKSSIIEKIFGEKYKQILDQVEKNIFIVHLKKPISIVKKIIVVIPSLSEKEIGFDYCFKKLIQLASEINASLLIYSNNSTKEYIQKNITKSGTCIFQSLSIFEDILIISKQCSAEDLVVVFMARKRTISYLPAMDKIPDKLDTYFSDNSKILIYPQQFFETENTETYEEVSSEPLNKGIETIQKIGKEIGNILFTEKASESKDNQD